MSEVDIAAGMVGISEIFEQLDRATVGVICLTPENLTAPWLLFEAGALSRQIGSKSRVCPFLLNLQITDVKKPLSEFQSVTADEGGTFKLLKSINDSLERPLSEDKLRNTFELWWPKFRERLSKIAENAPPKPNPPTESELLTEILGTVRGLARRLDDTQMALKKGAEQKGAEQKEWVIIEDTADGKRHYVNTTPNSFWPWKPPQSDLQSFYEALLTKLGASDIVRVLASLQETKQPKDEEESEEDSGPKQ